MKRRQDSRCGQNREAISVNAASAWNHRLGEFDGFSDLDGSPAQSDEALLCREVLEQDAADLFGGVRISCTECPDRTTSSETASSMWALR
jgi:hypothetical protein